jgi:N utilization substance protein A
LKRLFEMEVPEIYDGTVVIKSCVREPGDRAKIAVMSTERDVDPVGACVGMKGSRVQAIIRELRGEKIDIIEWSDEPSVFAANALSPAKVNQVRITDIENRQMEVIVNEDQLSLAIGKRGQNVRLASKLVGWNIDIRSEEEIKREVAEQMGAIIASGGAVPLSAIEGLTAAQADALAEHGITDIDALASTSVDDLVDHLDISLDEAESILSAAQAVIAARDANKQAGEEPAMGEAEGEQPVEERPLAAAGSAGEEPPTGEAESVTEANPEGTSMTDSDEEGREVEQHAFSAELDPDARPGDINPPDEMIAEGYDEAVRDGTPFTAEPNILAENSADPVALTEAEQMSEDELRLQGAERDLRPDTITPAPDITSSGAAYIEAASRVGEGEPPVEEDVAAFSPQADFASEASAPEIQTSSAPAPEYREDVAAPGESDDEEEKPMNSSEDNAAQ